MLSAILFDFDGTLVDMRADAWRLFAQTNAKYQLGVNSQADFYQLFEHNFFEALASLSTEAARVDAAKDHFLGLMRTEYDPPLIPGIRATINRLSSQVPLAILSSNELDTIRRVLQRERMQDHFKPIYSGDREPSKEKSITHFLTEHELAAAAVVLVTDTIGDIKEARAAGIRAVGVTWGMHTREALIGAGAEWVANDASQLADWVGVKAKGLENSS